MRTLPSGYLLLVSLVSWIDQSNGRKTAGEQSYTVPWRWTQWINRERFIYSTWRIHKLFAKRMKAEDIFIIIWVFLIIFTHCSYLWSSVLDSCLWTSDENVPTPPQSSSLVGRGTAWIWSSRLTCLLFANRTWHRQCELKNKGLWDCC